MTETETLDIRCFRCGKTPVQFSAYRDGAKAEGYSSAKEYVIFEEGTFNPENGHFACDGCYIEIGAPSSPTGWVAP